MPPPLIKQSDTACLFPNFWRPDYYQPENIPAEFSNDRMLFLPDELKTFTLCDKEEDWVREELWDVCSKRPYIWGRPYEYHIENYHLGYIIYAYACVNKFGFITEEQYHKLYRTKKGRKWLRNREKKYRCLVWYRRDDDTGPAPTNLMSNHKRIVQSSRVLSFFPGG
jgi:hypothetical protein